MFLEVRDVCSLALSHISHETLKRVLNRFFGTRELPHLKLGIRDFRAKSGRISGLKVCLGGGMPKITLGIT